APKEIPTEMQSHPQRAYTQACSFAWALRKRECASYRRGQPARSQRSSQREARMRGAFSWAPLWGGVQSVAPASPSGNSGAAKRALTVVDRVANLLRCFGIAFELHDRIGEHCTLLRFNRHASHRGTKQNGQGDDLHQKYTPRPPAKVWPFR